MGEFVLRIADSFELENPHAVGPDTGTGALLFAATMQRERLRSIVVGSGAAAFPLKLGCPLKEWIEATDLEAYRNTDPRQIVTSALSGIKQYALPEFVREDYLSAYEGDRFVESMRYVRAYPTDLRLLSNLLGEVATPVQIITGARDEVVPPVNGEFLHVGLRKSKVALLLSGHLRSTQASTQSAHSTPNQRRLTV